MQHNPADVLPEQVPSQQTLLHRLLTPHTIVHAAGALIGYKSAALGHLWAASRDAQGRVGHLEAAAAEITNVANEGDKPIQAVRQRLAKAGHTHNTDVETKSDYIWITNREKKALLDLAAKVARAGANATAGELEALRNDLTKLFDAAIAPE